ncbi:Putative antibiotic biosynthesis monooxygenase [Mycobacteroides abscessus]|uniref:putative quinol monooxygenase n=1 Tax=Mycobacteroides abscessus TaxID=36809 RepID=UPI0005E7F659|nr:putative quinol monooxygenase [Mycobacteroides abscessus]CPU65037.1 Putative antibiotic biosynthesis monooxygenase [Mycobacteroides abscessus]CPX55547.1 Putative antibiotic biosynthesis monooxygenase [Mycobacteroides abscessus]CPZ35250.1 Putative antibiotic biosynthesis monooxygenase [Mycobacteroides abscessus]
MPTVVAFLYPQPDKRDEVRAALLETIPQVHDEPGCNLYTLHEAQDRFVFVESWASGEALAEHGKAPAVTAMFGKVGPLLSQPPEIVVAEALPAGDPAKGDLVH